jgi:hypothetical protein
MSWLIQFPKVGALTAVSAREELMVPTTFRPRPPTTDPVPLKSQFHGR